VETFVYEKYGVTPRRKNQVRAGTDQKGIEEIDNSSCFP